MKQLNRFQYAGKLEAHGEVVPKSPKYVKGMLAFYEPCDVIVHVERRKRSRSKEQLGYYWGVVLPEIAAHTGHTVEDLHAIFKSKFLRTKYVWRATKITSIKSTSELTANEFAEYLSSVIAEAAELGIEVPEADKLYYFKVIN